MLRPSITNIQTSQRVPLTQNYFPSVYVKIFVTFATKVPYLTFCDKMRQFLTKEMKREGGNKEKMRKSKEWVSLHFFILPPFPHSLFIFSFSFHFLTARLPGCRKFCNPGTICKVSRKVSQGHSDKTNQQSRTRLNPLKSGRNPVWKGAPGVLFTLFLMLWWSGFLCERNAK